MPPRKSTGSAAAQTSDNTKSLAGADMSLVSNVITTEPTSPKAKKIKQSHQGDDTTIDDLLLPRSLISRISRGMLPPNTSIQKDAILALAKSATVFISHLAAEANDLTDRKTVQSQDVLKAIKEIEMDGVMELGKIGSDGRTGGRLEREVDMFEEAVRGKRKGYREKVKKGRESGLTQAGDESTIMTTNEEDIEEEDRGHQNKKVRRDEEHESSNDLHMREESANNHSNQPNTKTLDRSGQANEGEDEGDQTETDPEMADGNGEEDDLDEDDDDDGEDEDEEDEEGDEDETNEDELLEGNPSERKAQSKKERILAPEGILNVDSDNGDSEDDNASE